MDNILTAEHIYKDFVGHRALNNVSIEVPRGSVFGLLGPNGAGKTTLIRIINHITAPDAGVVTFDGHTLTADDVVNIGYLPEERGLYKKMKVGEQAMFFARLKGLSKREAESALKAWFERLEISEWWDKKIEELSKGMAQKVQFIVTVLHRPKLLIFDEPFSGFDPINAQTLKREILKLRDEGATIIFSSHNMASVEEVCDEICLINRSNKILSGKMTDIRERFAGNNYEISFAGNPAALESAIAGIGTDFSLGAVDSMGFARANISLPGSDAVRPLLAAANNAVAIESFRRVLPTMDDIFISAVEANNQLNSNTETPQA